MKCWVLLLCRLLWFMLVIIMYFRFMLVMVCVRLVGLLVFGGLGWLWVML